MKLLHIADLHVGKRVNGLSMIEEQVHIIDQLVAIAREQDVAGVLIAGDVFDRPHSSREALETCEPSLLGFLRERHRGLCHSRQSRFAPAAFVLLRFARLFGVAYRQGVRRRIDRFTIERDGERVCIHLLPFVRPTDVRMAMPDAAEEIVSHDDAVRQALTCDELDDAVFNILVAHQFVTASGVQPATCDSEIASVGGADNVDASAFDAYDYVALGHLHGAQHVGRPQIRYAGSPLKYSFSETRHEKSATILDIEDGHIEIGTCLLEPLHDMREIRASYEEICAGADGGDPLDYLRVTLTDKSLPDAMAKLRALYPNILRLDWEQVVAPQSRARERLANVRQSTPLELFSAFYEQQTGEQLTSDERTLVEACIEEATR